MRHYERRSIWAWALYDWANSAFTTTVAAGFFPIFFGSPFFHPEGQQGLSTGRLGYANALAGLVVVLLAPVLGAIADVGGLRKKLLLGCLALGVFATFGLSLVARGDWLTAALLFVVATVGFRGSEVFYDALLVEVAPPERRDAVSALGYALGYLGGGLLLLVNAAMLFSPTRFGLVDKDAAVQASFTSVSVWWAVFSVPLFLFVREPRRRYAALGGAMRAAFRQLASTVRAAHSLKAVGAFLLAYWLYIDGVHTVILMAMKFGQNLGIGSGTLFGALLMVQFVGFPATLVFGKVGQHVGAKAGILTGLAGYVLVTIASVFMTAERAWMFWVLAGVIGLVQGGVQALSRSLFSRLIPADQSAEFFGLYNVVGKLAALLGPFLFGTACLLLAEPRLAILTVLLLLIPGGLILLRLDLDGGHPEERGQP